MDLDYPKIIRMISQCLWPFARIGGLVLTVPIFSSGLLPNRIKIIIIMLLSWTAASLVPPQLSLLNFTAIYLVYVVQEILFGFLMGFALQLAFQVFIIGGQILSMQAGLGFAVMMDPASKASVPLVGQFYLGMMTLIFLSLNGHLLLIQTLMDSFKLMPIGELSVSSAILWKVLNFSGWMFQKALIVSIPAVLSLLIVSLSFGIMTRAAPQLNIFSLGFPITLLMGFVVIYITLTNTATQMTEIIDDGMRFLMGMIR
ncbi:MAG: flagellar biosynthetic protein FliR [Legionella sp. 40-6]|nr:flagellar biosynthetic protein FliR [Legionella sp.]OJX95313.1 MAG: flagellar biosynthetic protein FliR [Legionella sp. 40-6]